MATIRRSAKRASSSEGARARSTKKSNGALTDDQIRALVPPGLEQAYISSKLHDKRVAIAGLGEPPIWDGDMPEIPHDVATVDHVEMANLLAALVNAMSTALWQASKAYIEADMYDELAAYLEDNVMLETEQSNEGKRKAASRTDERVIAVKGAQKQAYHDYVRFRDLARTIELKWRTISRVGGFVESEAESENASAIKRSTRGRSAGAAAGKARGAIRRSAKR